MMQARSRNDAIRRLLPRAAVLALAAVAVALVLAAVNADARVSRAAAGSGTVLDGAAQVLPSGPARAFGDPWRG